MPLMDAYLLYTVYLIQIVGTLFLGLLLARFYTSYRHNYLREWSWSWFALCVYVVGGLLAVAWTRVYHPQHPVRLAVTVVTLVAGYSQIAFLLFGTYAVARGRPVSVRWRNGILAGCAALGVVIALMFTAEPALLAERYFTRIGLRAGAAAAAYLIAGVWLARQGGWRRGAGRAIVIASFLLYGSEQFNYFVINTLEFVGVRQFGSEVALLGVVDFLLQFSMGIGMVIWLLEEEGDELRRTAEALRRSEERARRSQRLESIGQLAGGVAHDFNNLLTVIAGRGQRLLEKLEAGTEPWQEAQQIDEAAARGAVLVRQLLAFSRKQVLAPQDVEANAVVRNVRSMLQRSIGDDIELRCELEPDLGWTRVDPAQLEQVLVNLVLNARDAMPDGGTITLSSSNVAPAWEESDSLADLMPGEHIELTVSDTGVGMDAETRRHVFEPFYTTKEVGKGTGLGMATAYGIVRQSGGSIVIDSTPGGGTTVHVYLPRVEPPVDRAPVGAVEEKAGTVAGDGGVPEVKRTVLVVEDDRHIRGLLTAVLTDNGYRVLTAENGAAALELAESNGTNVDLLLTDVVMPGVGGAELADRVTATHPGLKVLFMSGYSEEIVSSRLAADERMLLEKPFSLTDLLARVGEALERS